MAKGSARDPRIPVFRGCLGLNNAIDPYRITYDPATGVQEFAELADVDIDLSLRMDRRKGHKKRISLTGTHSLWSGQGGTFFAAGTSLYALNPDYTYTSIATVTSGKPIGFCQVNDVVVWGNGVEKGVIVNGVNQAWQRPAAYPTPPNHDQFTTADYADPPLANRFAFYNGRVYALRDNTAWASAYLWFAYFRPAIDRLIFPSKITMFHPVADGLYVSTDRPGEIWFLKGGELRSLQFLPLEKWAGPAIPGSDCDADTSKITSGKISAKGVIWTSPHAVVFGGPGGDIVNLTGHKLDYDSANESASVYDAGIYLTLLKP